MTLLERKLSHSLRETESIP